MIRALAILALASVTARAAERALKWTQLPALPNSEGVAAPFAGVCDGALIVAGGANFPQNKPWEGGQKVWHADIFALRDESWKHVGKLPRPLAYGLSITFSNQLICIGGSDANQHYADVYSLVALGGSNGVRFLPMPRLPMPCANMCGELIGTRMYVAGGTDSPTATNGLSTFWTLDLAAQNPRWEELEPLPRPGRMLAVSATDGRSFFIFSGAALHAGPDRNPVRTYLRDAHSYQPGVGWRALPKMPRPAVAAPSPAAFVDSTFYIISGDDGTLENFEPKERHPGFPRDILRFDVHSKAWEQATPRNAPSLSRSTAPLVVWRERHVLASGETQPGVRTPAVWSFAPQ